MFLKEFQSLLACDLCNSLRGQFEVSNANLWKWLGLWTYVISLCIVYRYNRYMYILHMGIYVCAVPMLYTLRIFGDFAMRFFRLNLHSRHLGPQNSQRTILSVYYSSCKCMIWLDQLRLTSVQKIVRLLLLIRTSKSRENRNSSLGNSFHLYMLYIYIYSLDISRTKCFRKKQELSTE